MSIEEFMKHRNDVEEFCAEMRALFVCPALSDAMIEQFIAGDTQITPVH